MASKDILDEFGVLSLGTSGIGSWIGEATEAEVIGRLGQVDNEPLSREQLNQLLILSKLSSVSDGFFTYYWLTAPEKHPYPVDVLPGFASARSDPTKIASLDQLKWGLNRLYVDGLLWFGNLRAAYDSLRSMTRTELASFFDGKRFRTEIMKERGQALPLARIAKDDRYLISEMACKSYGDESNSEGDLQVELRHALESHMEAGGGPITIRRLLAGELIPRE